MFSICLGILISILVCLLAALIYYGMCCFGNHKAFTAICAAASIVVICISVYAHKQMSLSWAAGFEAQKVTIETSLKIDALTGFERAQLVQQASEANKELAKRQYIASQWYGFDESDHVMTIEPVDLG